MHDLSSRPVGCRVNYHGVLATVVAHGEEFILVKFDNKEDGYGWPATKGMREGNVDLEAGEYYYWMYPNDCIMISVPSKVRIPTGLNCVVCNDRNEYAEPNMLGGKHICFSCRASYGWKYANQMM